MTIRETLCRKRERNERERERQRDRERERERKREREREREGEKGGKGCWSAIRKFVEKEKVKERGSVDCGSPYNKK